MPAKKKAKKPTIKTRATKVGTKVAKTGRNVSKAVGTGASRAKGKAVAAFGALKQKIRGKDEEE